MTMNFIIKETARFPITDHKTFKQSSGILKARINKIEEQFKSSIENVILTKWNVPLLPVRNVIQQRSIVIFIEDETTIDFDWIDENYKVFAYLPNHFYDTHGIYSEFFEDLRTRVIEEPIIPTLLWFVSCVLAIKGFLVLRNNGFTASISNDLIVEKLKRAIEDFDTNYLRAIDAIISIEVINVIEKKSINAIPKSKIGKFISDNIKKYFIRVSRMIKRNNLLDETYKFLNVVTLPLIPTTRRSKQYYF